MELNRKRKLEDASSIASDTSSKPSTSTKKSTQKDDIYLQFWSRASEPWNKLSNFAWIKEGIEYDGLVYPSTEHAFQAQKFIRKDRIRFSVDGDIGKVDDGFALFYSDDSVEKKKEFWMKKGNIGILAKMATSNANFSKLKLVLEASYDYKKSNALWLDLLALKFEIPHFKDILLSTESKILLEFDRTATPSSWYCCKFLDGALVGNNQMGKLIMQVRDSIYD